MGFTVVNTHNHGYRPTYDRLLSHIEKAYSPAIVLTLNPKLVTPISLQVSPGIAAKAEKMEDKSKSNSAACPLNPKP